MPLALGPESLRTLPFEHPASSSVAMSHTDQRRGHQDPISGRRGIVSAKSL
jgi:hypothetical protein